MRPQTRLERQYNYIKALKCTVPPAFAGLALGIKGLMPLQSIGTPKFMNRRIAAVNG
jgi:hypothetical protein